MSKTIHENKPAARNHGGCPVFAKWFEEFKADQEKLLRWDDTIGEDDED